ncbi:YfcC family protein [Urechidicola sp. KH5]
MKKIKFPTAHSILMLIALFVAGLTWLVPAGKYDTLSYNSDNQSFEIQSVEGVKTINASQEELDALDILIPLENFTRGAIYKPINIPNTYKQIEENPQGFVDFLMAPLKGIEGTIDIILLVLIIGGLIGIVNATGAFEAGIASLAQALKGREYILIMLVTVLVAIGGTTFGLEEETIAFYPILIPIFLAARYDALVAVACIYLGSSIGTLASTVNPFSVIIASNAAGINWTTGFTGRALMLITGMIISIWYILHYAKKIQKDPTKSIIYSQHNEIAALFPTIKNNAQKLTTKLKLVLVVFSLAFVVMVIGVSKLHWWFYEMTAIFLVAAVLIGIISKMKEALFIDTFMSGAADLLGVAFIIGIARGVTVLMDAGLISDTLLYYASTLTKGMNSGVFASSLMGVYSGLSFFIPSSSGMAVLTMPIMAPLADGIGVGREIVVNAYLFGMGLFKVINPTGLILASLAIVKVGYDKWLKFVWRLLLILTIFCIVFLTVMVMI